MFTYTEKDPTKSFTFTREQIKSLQDSYSKADSIADSIDSISNLDGCFTEVKRAIFFQIYEAIENCPDFFKYDEDEPFIDWFDNLDLNN